MPRRVTCLYRPALVSWLAFVALASLALAPAVAAFAAGYLSEPGPVRSTALLLWPDAWLSAPGKDAPEALPAVVASLLALLSAFGAWVWAVRQARGLCLDGVGPILALTVLILTPLLLMPRMQSSDVFLYDMYGRIISVHGANPILEPPLSFADEPLLSWVVWDYVPSAYGPLWLMASAAISGLAQPSVTAGVIGYRLAGVAVHLATTLVLWRLLRRHRPHMAVPGTLFYAWNPLVLLEVVGNAHNDGMVALCAVALAGASMRRAWVAAAVAAACAVMVKPFAAVLLPVLARQLAPLGREGGSWRPVASAAAAACATMVALSLPLWAGLALIRNTLENPAATMQTNSVWELASELIASGLEIAPEGQQPYLTALRAALFLGGAAWVLHRPIARLAMPASAVKLWVLFCLCSGWVWPWYLVPALALAPAAGRRLLPAGAGLTLGGLLFWVAWPEARPWPLDAVYPWRSLLLVGPFLLVTLWAPARAAVLLAFGWQHHRPRHTTLLPESPMEPAPG